jgi:molecular chaperone Hsp33
MTTATAIVWDDTVLPFQLDRADSRGRIARLDRTLDTILRQHTYPDSRIWVRIVSTFVSSYMLRETIVISLPPGDGVIGGSPTKSGSCSHVRSPWAVKPIIPAPRIKMVARNAFFIAHL